MTDLEVGNDVVERPRPSGSDCSLSAPALTKQRAGGLSPGSGVGVDPRVGHPRNATIGTRSGVSVGVNATIGTRSGVSTGVVRELDRGG